MAASDAPAIGRGRVSKLLADWLVMTLGECSVAMPMPPWAGTDVWSAPDVVGLRLASSAEDAAYEVVAVKIAYSAGDVPTALAQACSFKLCCHRVYLAMREDFDASQTERAGAVCLACRIGLIVFGRMDGKLPVFGLRVRAAAEEPGPFSSNPWIGILRSVRD
jgi:hypothetical protein